MIGLIGLDYRSADMDVRGRLTFAGKRLDAALHALIADDEIEEVIILSTCNRTEVYVASRNLAAAQATVKRFLADAFRRGPDARFEAVLVPAAHEADVPGEVAACLYERAGADAARHALRVAAGLRSMVVGEAQILGQVKEALAVAQSAGTAGDELRSLFTTAIKVGKRARTETEIGKADVSVAALALRVAHDQLGDLTGKTVLLVGAGRTCHLCAQLAHNAGAGRIVLANRTVSAAADIAAEVAGEAITLDAIGPVLAQADLLICATAAPHTILSASTVAAAVVGSAASVASAASAGRSSPLVILDLAVPPDVQESVRTLPDVALHTLDTLRELDPAAVGEPLPLRDAEVAQVEQIVDEGVREMARTRALRMAVPGIAALRRHVDRSEQAELARTLARLDHLTDEDRAIVERFGRRLVDKMFHHLVSRIRSLTEDEGVAPEVTMQVLARLFADPDEHSHTPADATDATDATDAIDAIDATSVRHTAPAAE